MNIRQILIWALKLIAAIILLQTLYFKFTAHPQSVALFTKIGLEPYGRVGIGILELFAAILILIPRTVSVGSLLGAGLMSGALFFHLTSLGIEVDGDKVLFYYALIVFVACTVLLIIFRHQLISFIQFIMKTRKSSLNMLLLVSISLLFSNCSYSQKNLLCPTQKIHSIPNKIPHN